MYTLSDPPAGFDHSNKRCKDLVTELLPYIQPRRTGLLIPAGTSLLEGCSSDSIFFLRRGLLQYQRRGKVIFFFEEEDLVGLVDHFCPDDTRIASELAVEVDEYSYKDMLQAVSENPPLLPLWTEYLAQQLNLFSLVVSDLTKDVPSSGPDLRTYPAGATIIAEKTDATEVFSLVEGTAEVIMGGQKVGEVLRDEIFGAMSALSNSPRTATVIAKTECVVLALPKENFVSLMESRPETVFKMVEDMARVIVSLNDRIVATKMILNC